MPSATQICEPASMLWRQAAWAGGMCLPRGPLLCPGLGWGGVLQTAVLALWEPATTDPSLGCLCALQALYNIMRASRVSGSLAPQFPQVLAALFAVYGDSSPDVQNAAAVLDNLLKDIAAEAVHSLEGLIPLMQEWLGVSNAVKQRWVCCTHLPRSGAPFIRRGAVRHQFEAGSVVSCSFVLGWISFLDSLPEEDIKLVEHLHQLLPGLLRLLGRSDEQEIRSTGCMPSSAGVMC